MSKIQKVRVNEEEIHLKKDFMGWRVVHPIKKDEKLNWNNFYRVINWENLIAGGSWYKLIILILAILIILGAINEYTTAIGEYNTCIEKYAPKQFRTNFDAFLGSVDIDYEKQEDLSSIP